MHYKTPIYLAALGPLVSAHTIVVPVSAPAPASDAKETAVPSAPPTDGFAAFLPPGVLSIASQAAGFGAPPIETGDTAPLEASVAAENAPAPAAPTGPPAFPFFPGGAPPPWAPAPPSSSSESEDSAAAPTKAGFAPGPEALSWFTTFCPEPTTLTWGSTTICVTEPTTLTLTSCPETTATPPPSWPSGHPHGPHGGPGGAGEGEGNSPETEGEGEGAEASGHAHGPHGAWTAPAGPVETGGYAPSNSSSSGGSGSSPVTPPASKPHVVVAGASGLQQSVVLALAGAVFGAGLLFAL
ncbi:hypothetical protein B0T19DRAFT_442971 [Cercophora scortea]|uniref:Uncharacterized protein n=1 Tax=Cercophora scortea TaxID=314031 RepID=A0AAE0IEC1_9PEZI|nr:hypothetical protein B0T19DRAFT_442971 [Cercophora scortea]